MSEIIKATEIARIIRCDLCIIISTVYNTFTTKKLKNTVNSL